MLALNDYRRATAFLRLGDDARADEDYRKCLDLRVGLQKQFPGDPELQIDVMVAQGAAGCIARPRPSRELRQRHPDNTTRLLHAACGYALSAFGVGRGQGDVGPGSRRGPIAAGVLQSSRRGAATGEGQGLQRRQELADRTRPRSDPAGRGLPAAHAGIQRPPLLSPLSASWPGLRCLDGVLGGSAWVGANVIWLCARRRPVAQPAGAPAPAGAPCYGFQYLTSVTRRVDCLVSALERKEKHNE